MFDWFDNSYHPGNGLVEPDSIGFITNPAGDGEFQYTGDESNQTVYPSGWKFYNMCGSDLCHMLASFPGRHQAFRRLQYIHDLRF